MNSRLDTIRATVLQVKFEAYKEYELTDVNKVAKGSWQDIEARKLAEKLHY